MDVQEPIRVPNLKVVMMGRKYFWEFVCLECGEKNRGPVKRLREGSILKCRCGKTTMTLTGDNIAVFQTMGKRGGGVPPADVSFVVKSDGGL
ncbi:MAG: hypothetical protein WAM82_36150 [Thermoanaerobaculia bacterium]